MVREDILGGLRVALSKGHSLQDSMQSFYNSGYSKEEIEEAARYIQSEQSSGQSFSSAQQPLQKSTPQPTQQVQQPKPEPKPIQQFQPVQSQPSYKPIVQQPPQKVTPQPTQPFQQQPLKQINLQPSQPFQQPSQIIQQPLQQLKLQEQYQYNPLPSQRVSNYDQKITKRSDAGRVVLLIFLFLLLIALVGGLVSVFLFKEEILGFFGK